MDLHINAILLSQAIASKYIILLKDKTDDNDKNINKTEDEFNDNSSETTLDEESNYNVPPIHEREDLPVPSSTVVKICVFCYCSGHWANTCPTIPMAYKNKCFKCWQSGHFSKNCANLTKPPWMSPSQYEEFNKIVYERRKQVSFS